MKLLVMLIMGAVLLGGTAGIAHGFADDDGGAACPPRVLNVVELRAAFEILPVLFQALGDLRRAERGQAGGEGCCFCQAELDALEYDLYEIISDIQTRLGLLEKMHHVY